VITDLIQLDAPLQASPLPTSVAIVGDEPTVMTIDVPND